MRKSSAGEVEDCNQASDKESLRVWREIIWHQQKSIWILLWNNYQDWMRNRNTVEFLAVWEELHNPDFNRNLRRLEVRQD